MPMKNLIFILILVFFNNTQAVERDAKTFECQMREIRVITLQPSKMNWQDDYDSLEEFEAALLEGADNYKLKDFNLQELDFARIYNDASLVIEATVKYEGF